MQFQVLLERVALKTKASPARNSTHFLPFCCLEENYTAVRAVAKGERTQISPQFGEL